MPRREHVATNVTGFEKALRDDYYSPRGTAPWLTELMADAICEIRAS